MKKAFLGILCYLCFALMTVCSCQDDEPRPLHVEMLETTIRVTLPLNLNAMGIQSGGEVTLQDEEAVLTHLESNKTYKVNTFNKEGDDYVAQVTIPSGRYDINFRGKILYGIDGTMVSKVVQASSKGVEVNSQNIKSLPLRLNLSIYSAKDGFVISELYIVGSKTPKGTGFTGDQYIKVANNSDKVLYADSLLIVESAFSNNQKRQYSPDIMDKAMAVDVIYMIPGKGHDVPVAPGASITIAVNAQNHRTDKTFGYLDTSSADFEIYDASDKNVDIDNPQVKNLDKWYSYSASFTILNQQMSKSYAIAKLDQAKEVFLKENSYVAKWLFVFKNTTREMTTKAYKIPNVDIIDAVNVGFTAEYQWNIISPKLDAGYTYVGNTQKNKDYYGRSSIRRKQGSKYVDTNDSSSDFEHGVKPSLAQ